MAPETDPGRITVAFEGVRALSVDAEGNLVLQTRHGDVTQQRPVIYQEIDGNRHAVEGSYVLRANDQVGFEVGSYDTTQPLVIDPVLSYSTYLGGNGNDIGNAIAVDSAGDAYITGETFSTNFPGASGSPIQPLKSASYDVFVTKLNAAGTAVVYSTYLGGSGGDFGEAIAVDSTGSAYVTGQTDSPTAPGPSNIPFPTTAGVVQPLYRLGGDASITKISASGNALGYSTYLGGSGAERGYGIAVDSVGNVFVTGETNSDDFPTASAVQPTYAGAGPDAFVLKIAPSPPILEPPTNLVASSVSGNTVTLNWTAPAHSITPTGYVLEGGVSPGQVLASISTGSAATSFTLVAPTGSFYLRLRSTAAGATSVASNEIRVFVNTPAPPSAPVNVLGLVTGSRLDLAWRNTAGGGTPTALILDVTGTLAVSMTLPVTEAFSFASVPAGTYTMSLRASNSSGVSASSNPVTLTFPTACGGAPSAPAGFVASAAGNVINASWSLPASGPAPTGYTLIVTGAFNGSFAVAARSLAGAVGPGTYTLSVSARNACGTSAASTPQTVTIP